MKTIIVDIETAALSESELKPFMPEFTSPANYRDESKIKEAINAKRKAWIEDAALDPLTGSVLAIGLLIDESFVAITPPATEAIMLHEFWDLIQGSSGWLHRIVGFNCYLFDLPFMIRRSWKLGVQVPIGVRRGRYWDDQVTDLRDMWQLGDRQAHGSLDTIAKHLGVGAKTGSGADFAKTWAEDQAKALDYLKNDLMLTSAIAKKLGVL